MITIKTTSKDNAELVIKKGTPFITMLLGIEMLVEALMKDSNINLGIDNILDDIKRIYITDNGEHNNGFNSISN